jgi:DNA gyrase subunit A
VQAFPAEDGSRFIVMGTRQGIVKKTDLTAFSNPRAAGIIAIQIDDDDRLIAVADTDGTRDLVIGSRNGMAIRFAEADVRPMGRTARGVRGMQLRDGDQAVAMEVVTDDGTLLTVCENGYGKRTPIEEYRKTARGTKGVINIKTTERNGEVVSITAVEDDDELMFITAGGIALRTDLSAIREIGRATQGVRLIRLDEGDRVVAVEKFARENGDDEEDDADDKGHGVEPTSNTTAPDPTPDARETPDTE